MARVISALATGAFSNSFFFLSMKKTILSVQNRGIVTQSDKIRKKKSLATLTCCEGLD
jgi:hypothetical protein